ncbi:MAG: hypothetical protein AAF378_07240 [Cyanobacteria bacterium P01_A01_bin.84]
MSNNHEKAVVERRGFRPNSLVKLGHGGDRENEEIKVPESLFFLPITNYPIKILQPFPDRL